MVGLLRGMTLVHRQVVGVTEGDPRGVQRGLQHADAPLGRHGVVSHDLKVDAAGPEEGDVGATAMHLGKLDECPSGDARAPATLQPGHRSRGRVGVECDRWSEDIDLVEIEPSDQVDVRRRPRPTVDVAPTPDHHRLVPRRDGARSHHGVSQVDLRKALAAEGDPLRGVVVEGNHGQSGPWRPAGWRHVPNECADAVKSAGAQREEGRDDGGRGLPAQTTDPPPKDCRSAEGGARPGWPRASRGVVVVVVEAH